MKDSRLLSKSYQIQISRKKSPSIIVQSSRVINPHVNIDRRLQARGSSSPLALSGPKDSTTTCRHHELKPSSCRGKLRRHGTLTTHAAFRRLQFATIESQLPAVVCSALTKCCLNISVKRGINLQTPAGLLEPATPQATALSSRLTDS